MIPLSGEEERHAREDRELDRRDREKFGDPEDEGDVDWKLEQRAIDGEDERRGREDAVPIPKSRVEGNLQRESRIAVVRLRTLARDSELWGVSANDLEFRLRSIIGDLDRALEESL